MGEMMNTFNFFEDFLSIPRESGHERRISEYLCRFAKKYHLAYEVDCIGNVIIKKQSNNGSKDSIILQAHTDMVCTSTDYFDFENKGIDWYIDDGFYKANKTTLGADDGIGCAIILAILANDDISIPNIEAVFTVQEETTMEGAYQLDYTKLNSHKLISLDGTSEGVIEVSSAGMAIINVSKDINYTNNDKPCYKISISGLLGGHSGTDIDKNRGNAIKIMGELLYEIDDVGIVSILGGDRLNVIPSSCTCIIATEQVIKIPETIYAHFPTIKIDIEQVDQCAKVMTREDSNTIVEFMHNIPVGVLTYADTFPQTSLNLGKIYFENEVMHIDLSIRSSDNADEEKYIHLVKELCTRMTFKLVDQKPFFTYKEISPLRELLMNKYEKLYGKKVVLERVHAGLEVGIFAKNIDNLDACVIAPNIYDLHSVNERVEIESVIRVYDWLVAVLQDI